MTVTPISGLREMRVTYHPDTRNTQRPTVGTPRELAALLTATLSLEVVEVFRSVYLTTRHGVIATVELSRGTVDGCAATPRDVVLGALMCNAKAVVLAHNHPSGDPTPSPDDLAVTRRIVDAARLFDIDVIDHLIIGAESRYFSFRESSCL